MNPPADADATLDGMERTATIDRTGFDGPPGYELLGRIGAGACGTVYKARDLKFDRVVAVKVIPDTGDAARFEAEAAALGRCRHPNVVHAYDVGRQSGRLFIVMELLDGEDLEARVERAGPVPERLAWAVVRQAAVGLAHAAANGLVHRDVKPANLFLSPAPTGSNLPAGVPLVKVTDFGLVLAQSDHIDDRLTAPGMVVGSPAYMAPEQCRGSADLDHRVDIYGLGAAAFHALAGHPPFSGATLWDVVASKLAHRPDFGRVSAASRELVLAMMAPDRDDRPRTYDDLLARIDRVDGALASGRVGRRLPRRLPRRLLRRAGLMLLAVTLIAAGGWGVGRALTARPVVRYKAGAHEEALFDGRSLGPWLAGGAWALEPDDEGAPTLAGSGTIRRRFPEFDAYRLTVGLDLAKADAAEVQFAIPAGGADDRLAVRVTPAGGAVLGSRTGGTFRPLGPAVPLPPPNWFAGRRPYLEVRVERTPAGWSAWFNGQPAGTVADAAPKAPVVQLVAEGGPLRVDTVVVQNLVAGQ